MKKICCVTLLFLGQQAFSETLYCVVLSDVIIEIGGKEIDSYIYDESDHGYPENWIEFDFENLTTTFFWSDEDSEMGHETENLTQINDQLYYARVNESEYVGYSTYLFEEGKEMGMLTEDGYVSSFQCWQKNQKEIEKEYGISFQPYY